jgi:outer membrane murein-binding lipoprotein Lpp
MMTSRYAAPVLSAVAVAGLVLSGCASKDAQKEATSTSASTTTSATSETSSSAAETTSATAAKPAGDKVATPDLPGVVNDRTFRGEYEGKPYAEYYAPDGSMRGKLADEAYTGSWQVVGEQLCFTYPKEDQTDCYDVFKNGEAFTWVGPDGKVVETTFVEGNPDQL